MRGTVSATVLALALACSAAVPGCEGDADGGLRNHATCLDDGDCASGNCLPVGDTRSACMEACTTPGRADGCPAGETCVPPGDAGQQAFCGPTCTRDGDPNCLSRNAGLVRCVEGLCADAG